MLPGDKSLWLMLGTAGAALAMLGPGLWSGDARLYGWKRLEPTPRKKEFGPQEPSKGLAFFSPKVGSALPPKSLQLPRYRLSEKSNRLHNGSRVQPRRLNKEYQFGKRD